ncbi:MAG: D-alanyl-D-alanine carboxypeptidase family protein [Alphaproteobacteria bacterium]|nr:D-alanyl-D-alanine carboxypeptidase family protein [Alphaproteobacteria bacterium]
MIPIEADRRRRYVRFGRLAMLALLALVAAPAAALETPARHALLIDFETGTVLLEKDSDVPMPPASMSKLMTSYMAFHALKNQDLDLDHTFTVSKKAWKMGGSKMFVEVNKEVRVGDLLLGVIVQSGNDACIVLAEGLAGTEEAFAQEMNEMAKKIGLRDSTFRNASGWPDPEHLMSARDLAELSRRIITDFPKYYEYFKIKEYTYNKIRQGNRNPLLYKSLGADGLKTGHTEASGYGLVASAKQGDRRLILVVNGLKSVNQRSRESARLLNWGFRQFNNYVLFKPGEAVAEGLVWLGAQETVPLVLEKGLTVTLPRKARRGMKVSAVYDGPIPPPIRKGQVVARLRVEAPGAEAVEHPLIAAADVEQLGPVGRLWAALRHLLLGAAAPPKPAS